MFCKRVLWFLLPAAAIAVAGCDRDGEVKVYRVAKPDAESSPVPHVHTRGETPAAEGGRLEGARLVGVAPERWLRQPPSSMRQVSFLVRNEAGAEVDVALVVLAGDAGGPLDNVNRWRAQLGQTPLTAEQLGEQAVQLDAQLGEVLLVDIEGEAESDHKETRIVAAIMSRPGESWFFKMQGERELAGEEKENFVEWIKSLHIAGPAPAASEDAGHDPNRPIHWQTPDGWTEEPPSETRYASFITSGDNGGVSVVVLPGDGGSDAENVNRWRGQLGHEPALDSAAAALLKPVPGTMVPISMVELSAADGGGQAMLAAVARHGGHAWFFRMTGTEAVVKEQREAFVAFLRSVHFH